MPKVAGRDGAGRGAAPNGDASAVLPSTRKTSLAALAAALLAIGLYWPVLRHDFVAIDTAVYVTQNEHVRAGLSWAGVRWAFTSFDAANWHPLTWLSHMLDVQLFGLSRAGHHGGNLLFFAATCALLVVVVARSTRSLGASLAVGLLFAAHPLHVESVAWIVERKDVLSGFFAVCALLAWERWVRSGSRRAWTLALVLFALGLMAKPMLVTAPFVLLLLDLWPFERAGPTLARRIGEKLPFFALSLASSIVTFLAQRSGGAVQDIDRLTLGPRAANAIVAYATYVRRTFWPSDLAVYYPLVRGGPGAVSVALGALVLVSISALAWWQRRARPWILVGWLCFLGGLVPVIGLVQVGGQALADRYMYLPIVGLAVALVWTGRDLVRSTVTRVALVVAAVGALSFATVRQVATWQDSESVALQALAVTHDNALAEHLLGFVLGWRNELEESLAHLEEAVRIEPGDLEARDDLAVVLVKLNRIEEGERELRLILAHNPRSAKSHEHLAAILLARGDVLEAKEHLLESVRLLPGTWTALASLGEALRRSGDLAGARSALERALRLEPTDLRSLVELARLELETVDDSQALDRAAALLARALAVDPDSAQALQQRARLRSLRKDLAGARADLERALAARPGWPQAKLDLAWILALDERAAAADREHALQLAEQAAGALAGNDAAALDVLGVARAANGRFTEAAAAGQRAVELARTNGDTALAERAQRRLDGYRRGELDRAIPR